MNTESEIYTVPARSGKAARLEKGQSIKIINTHGQQVVDTWAFNANDLKEFMSMEHMRVSLGRLIPAVGDPMMTNHRRPVLTMVEDTSPGIHDTLCAACDVYRYRSLGCTEYHDNCTDNLAAAMAELDLHLDECPAPLNMWMNIPIIDGRSIDFLPPVSKPGDHVVLRAEMDCVVAMSCCPQDMIPINGETMNPTEAHFRILS